METKSKSDEVKMDPKNPFVHNVDLSKLQILKLIVFGITLLPIRLMICLIFVTLSTVMAMAALYGITDKELEERPFTGWRLTTRLVVIKILRLTFFLCGFHWIRTKGRRATPGEAPIIIVAPHSSFFDGLAVMAMEGPSVVAKSAVSSVPFWGSLIRLAQPVLVHRTDPDSRQNTIRQIVERSSPGSGWQQIFIFPEGTCTNRSCLITFRLGAFIPGVPVQPVCLSYNNSLDSITWTWEGISSWKVLFWTLSQPNVNFEMEYLEPYVPNKLEIEQPKLYAANVRSVMAKCLNIPTTDYTYFDYLRIEKSRERLKILQKLQRRMDGTITDKTQYVLEQNELQCRATVGELSERLGVADVSAVHSAFVTNDAEETLADVRQLRVAALVASADDGLEEFLRSFSLFDRELGEDTVGRQSLIELLQHHIFLSHKESVAVADEVETGCSVSSARLRDFLATSRTNYVKVIRSVEGRLTEHERKRDILAKSATRTAEMMAASGSQLLSAGKSGVSALTVAGKDVVSDVSAKMAAGREKMSDALSSSAAAGAAALSMLTPATKTHKKTKSE